MSSTIDIDGKYLVKEAVYGAGTWAQVRECVPVQGYSPPGYEALRSVTSAGENNGAMPKLVAKIIDKEKLKAIVKSEDSGHAIVARELTILESLPPHVGVVRFVECIESDKNYFLIFEAAVHGDLCELLLKSPTQRLDEASAQKYVAELIFALIHCHRHGVCHRDIKPENILVAAGNVCKIADYGLAKTASGGPASAAFSLNAHSNNSHQHEPDAPTHPAPHDLTLSLLFPHRIFPRGTSLQTIIIEHRLRKASAAGAGPGGGSTSSRLATAAALASAMDVPLLPSMLPAAPPCPGHEIMGTFRYGAPEMFEAKFSNGSFDAFLADAWSLGVVAFIMLTGTFPFSAGSSADERQTWKVLRESPLGLPLTREEGGETSAEACDFLRRLLEKNPARRMKLWDALDHPWLSGEVRRQQHLARDCFLLPPRVPPARPAGHAQHVVSLLADNNSPEFAAACQQLHPLSAALEQMRALIVSSTNSSGGSVPVAELRALYNALVVEHYHRNDAMARMRQSLAFGGVEDQHRAAAVAAVAAAAGSGVRSASAGRPNATAAGAGRGVSPGPGRPGATTPTPGRAAAADTASVATASGGISSAARGRITPTRVGATPAATATRASPSPGMPARSSAMSPSPANAMNSSNNSGGAVAGSGGAATAGARQGAQSPLTRFGQGARRPTPGRVITKPAAPPSGSTTARSAAGASMTGPSTVSGRRGSPSPSARISTPVAAGGASPNAAATVPRAAKLPVSSAAAAAAADPMNPANIRSLSGLRTAAAAAASTTASGGVPALGDTVTYKNSAAVVRFVGPTKFAPGQWIGLELLEGDGLHDGTSSIDKKRYFQCPPGKGVFVRPAQL